MLSLPNDGRYPTLELTPEQRRQKTLEALISQMEALSRQNPVLMIFEDAHWTDPTSLELFGRIVDRIRSLRVLLIVTFRPEFEPPWIGRPHVTALTINRLAQRDIEAMIDRVIGNKLLPANIRHDIIERTDGIPLFVEEMTKAVLEAGSEGAARNGPLRPFHHPTLAVPASLHASLMARLDRLGPAKEVAQIGAAIGREFSHALCWLRWCTSRRRSWNRRSTVSLPPVCCSGRAYRRMRLICSSTPWYRMRPTARCCAKPRRALHARIAETLGKPIRRDRREPAGTARASLHRGWPDRESRASGARRDSGRWTRSALVEAVEQLTRALDQIATLPATPALRREQIKLQVALITPLLPCQRLCRA